MKRSLRIAALPLAVIALTLLASGCSKNSGDDSDAQGDKVQIVDGEVLLINSATPWTDRSLDVVHLSVVADRVDYRQFAMEFFVSGESSPELHAIVVENVGNKLRVRTEENQIVAAEELVGRKRVFIPVNSSESLAAASVNQSEVASDEQIEEEPPPYGWNFLVGHCFYKGEDLGKCEESYARTGNAAGAYDVFGEDRIDMYSFDPQSIPVQSRKDQHIVVENFVYEYDKATKGVIVRIRTQEGCVMSSLYSQATRWSVHQRFLDIAGTCTDIQRKINDQLQASVQSNGPVVLYPARRGSLISVE
jgi:hypothetical protein